MLRTHLCCQQPLCAMCHFYSTQSLSSVHPLSLLRAQLKCIRVTRCDLTLPTASLSASCYFNTNKNASIHPHCLCTSGMRPRHTHTHTHTHARRRVHSRSAKFTYAAKSTHAAKFTYAAKFTHAAKFTYAAKYLPPLCFGHCSITRVFPDLCAAATERCIAYG
jgi:hypothetical protein